MKRLFTALLSIITLATSGVAAPADLPSPHGVWPLAPHSVIRGFEPPSNDFSVGHRGVDLLSAIGRPVLASLGGTVTFAGVVAGRGVVVVRHGDTRTTYEPVIAEVRQGEVVHSGARLGTLEITQSHCFPLVCLHWGWLRDAIYLDPLLLLQEPPKVRLLPLRPGDALADRQP